MQKLITKLILLSFLFFACKSKNNADNEKRLSIYPSAGLVDTVFRFYDIQGLESYLNIKSLRKGADLLEIRIYTISSLDEMIELFTIKTTKDSLIKKHYTVLLKDKDFIYNSKKDSTKNNCGNFSLMHEFLFKKTDSSFVNLFQKSRLDTLPTQRDIPNLKGGCLDGATYIIEIGTTKSYRCLMYDNPDCYKESKQCLSFDSFLSNFYSLLNIDEFKWYKNNGMIKSLNEN